MGRKKESLAEYIWLDGAAPTQQLRSKTRILFHQDSVHLKSFPDWSFDGSSTAQASGSDSDCILKPIFFTKDPFREGDHYVVLCEVFDANNNPHLSNKRAPLRNLMEKAKSSDPYIGFEQEYTLFSGDQSSGKWPLGWPHGGFPSPQGPFYCGVGANKVHGRNIVEEHVYACQDASLNIYGINAEVMPAQWEFQIGYRQEGEVADPLIMSDHLWVARYLLHRISEKYNVTVSFSNKPIPGDWNGAGMHTNFSTKETRDKKSGMKAIETAIKHLEENHRHHISNYGQGLEQRLTGQHETCHISEFKAGISNRGASIRIPISTHRQGYGYIEDRRPGSNSDPYIVSALLVETICLSN